MKTSTTSEKLSHAHKELLIDIDNLTVRLGHETALDNVSFCVHAGEFIGIVGPNGAGKTTLLRSMLGLIKPNEGVINKSRATISYIPQHGNLYTGSVPMSVMEVVNLGARGSTAAALEALKQVGMQDAAKRRFSDLSGGQRQRVAIAKALASNPDILILDEPTTGIDEHSQTEFYETLHTLHERNITIITVAHEVDILTQQAERIICLNRDIQYDGPAAEFDAHMHLPSFYKDQHNKVHHQGGHHA